MSIKYDPILGKLRVDDSGVDGTSSYTYIAYASDDEGTGFNLTPSAALPYRAEIVSATALTPPTSTDFASAVWVKYLGTDGADGAPGAGFSPDVIGLLSGLSTYDDEPAGFTYLASDTGNVYFKLSATTADWSNPVPFKGEKGDDGAKIVSAGFDEDDMVFGLNDSSQVSIVGAFTALHGNDGDDGVSTYTYIAYASDDEGTGFSLTPTDALKYRAEIKSSTELTPPTSSDFTGATWVKYLGDDGAKGADGDVSVATANKIAMLNAIIFG